ncbi:MAG TPA: histidine kinase dimerization/phospho-acceptor domain-containing protein, partial [Longimicrobiales bacterium]|nr:histidine kinase dimerization/phospho-acceptor domain-containing protein [Longimicrobiales bacterium]
MSEGGSTGHALDLAAVLDAAPCGFISFADDGRITLVNATLLDMLGHARADLEGHSIERIFTVGSRIFYQTHWFPLLRMHGSAEEIFLMLRTQSGEDVGVLVNAVRRERDGGTVFDCVMMRVRERQKFEDELVRARRVAEAAAAELRVANAQLEAQAEELEAHQHQLQEQTVELEMTGEELRVMNEELLERSDELALARATADEANAAKSTFLAVMSHELRTPLNAISGYVELLEMGVYGPVVEKQLDALDRIRRSQRHLLRLVNEILNLARIESGHVDYDLEDIPLAELIAEVRPLVEPQLAEKGLHFEARMTAGAAVRADREKLQQVLLNLLSNAIKFTPEGGHVSMTSDVRQTEPRV